MRGVRLVTEVGGPVGILDIIMRGVQLGSDEAIGVGSDAVLRDADMIQ